MKNEMCKDNFIAGNSDIKSIMIGRESLKLLWSIQGNYKLEKKNHHKLCEMMEMYQAYHDSAQVLQYVLRGTKLSCTYGTKLAVMDTIEDNGIYKGRMPVMLCKDCKEDNLHNFGFCRCPESRYINKLPMTVNSHSMTVNNYLKGNVARMNYNYFAHICVPCINPDAKWMQEDKVLMAGQMDGTYEPILLSDAFLVCKYGGLIRIQEVPEYDKEDEYRRYLQKKGFPNEYIDCLEILHDIYPVWEFEAIQTNIDFEEFVDFQYKKKYKCTRKKSESDGKIYEGEKSGKYFEVKREVIHQYANPCNILQYEKGKKIQAMQFLKAEQSIPKEYSDEIVEKIMGENYNKEVVEKVKNMKIRINPIFIAAIMCAENGPFGEEYNGVKIYNMFNFGANDGREEGRKYAYEHKWFTAEACLDNSEELFNKYLDRGQDTLYALDWHFAAYKKGDDIMQYATLVTDARDKAAFLTHRNDEAMQLPLVFSIPIYDNIVTECTNQKE